MVLMEEINKIHNKTQKDFTKDIYRFEKDNDIELESNEMLAGIIPTKIGLKYTKDTDEIRKWYQQYRTIKALIKKQQKQLKE